MRALKESSISSFTRRLRIVSDDAKSLAKSTVAPKPSSPCV
jgi:hypothetical protein